MKNPEELMREKYGDPDVIFDKVKDIAEIEDDKPDYNELYFNLEITSERRSTNINYKKWTSFDGSKTHLAFMIECGCDEYVKNALEQNPSGINQEITGIIDYVIECPSEN